MAGPVFDPNNVTQVIDPTPGPKPVFDPNKVTKVIDPDGISAPVFDPNKVTKVVNPDNGARVSYDKSGNPQDVQFPGVDSEPTFGDRFSHGWRQGGQSGSVGWVARKLLDYADFGMDGLKKKFPGKTPEQYEALHEAMLKQAQLRIRKEEEDWFKANPAQAKDESFVEALMSGKWIPGTLGEMGGGTGVETAFSPGATALQRVIGQGAVSGLTDLAVQAGEKYDDIRDSFDPEQIAMQTVFGAGTQGLFEGIGKLVKAAQKGKAGTPDTGEGLDGSVSDEGDVTIGPITEEPVNVDPIANLDDFGKEYHPVSIRDGEGSVIAHGAAYTDGPIVMTNADGSKMEVPAFLADEIRGRLTKTAQAPEGPGTPEASATPVAETPSGRPFDAPEGAVTRPFDAPAEALPPVPGEAPAVVEAPAAPLAAAKVRGVPRADVEGSITQATEGWVNSPEFVVVDDLKQLPVSVRKGMKADKASRAEAVAAKDGKIYVLAHNIKDPSRIPKIVFHEALGHKGLGNRFAEDLDNVLMNIYKGHGALRKEADAFLADPKKARLYQNRKNPTARAMEEILANLSENGPIKASVLQKVTAWFRNWARQKGIKMFEKMSDSEVIAVMSDAHRTVTKGDGIRSGGDADGHKYMYVAPDRSDPDERFVADLAEEMYSEGHSPATIRDYTGMHKGPEGALRKEISDSDVSLDETVKWNIKNNVFKKGTLSDIMDHPELFKRYPDLKNVNVQIIDEHPGLHGGYNKDTNTLLLNKNSTIDPETVVLHEVQHSIQDMEGWAAGGNKRSVLADMSPKQYRDFLDEAHSRLSKTVESFDYQAEKGTEVLNHPLVGELMKANKSIKASSSYEKSRGRYDIADNIRYKIFEDVTGIPREEAKYASRMNEEERGVWYMVVGESDLSGLIESIRLKKALADYPRKDLATLEKHWQDKRKIQQKLGARLDEDLFSAYENLFGEIEARDTMKRWKMTAEERKSNQPYDAEGDIPTDKVIVKTQRASGTSDMAEADNRYSMSPEEDADFERRLATLKSDKDIMQMAKAIGEGYKAPPSQTHDETKTLAEMLNISRAKFLKLHPGLKPEEAYGMSVFVTKGLEKTLDLSKKISRGGDMQNLDAFKRQVALMATTLDHYMNVRSDMGRVFNAMGIAADSKFGRGKAAELSKALSGVDLDDPDNLYRIADMLRASNDPQLAAKILQDLSKPFPEDYFTSLRYSLMLSSFSTHGKNMLGNITLALTDFLEHGLGAVAGQFRRFGKDGNDRITGQEMLYRMYGPLRAIAEMSTYKDTWEAVKIGHPTHTVSKVETHGHTLPLPWVTEYPKKLLAGADQFFRAFIENSQLYGLAVRQARKEGKKFGDAFERANEIIANPSEELLKQADVATSVIQLVDDPSALGAFFSKGKVRKAKMTGGERAIRFALQHVIPFSNVADRLLWTNLRRSPLGFLDKDNRRLWQSGSKANQDLVKARLVLGSAVIGYFTILASRGELTGNPPEDYARTKQNEMSGGTNKWNALKKDGEYTSLAGLDSVGALANIVATTVARHKSGEMDDLTFGEQMAQLAGTTGKLLADNAFTSQLGDYLQTAQRGQAGDQAINNVVPGMAASFVVPAIVKRVQDVNLDGYDRNTTGDGSLGDRIEGRIASGYPGYAETLPIKHDPLGRKIKKEGLTHHGIARTTKEDPDPVVQEVLRLSAEVDDTLVEPVKRGDVKGRKLDAEELEEYQELAGRWILEDLRNMMSDPEWEAADDNQRAEWVNEVVKAQKKNARDELYPKGE